MDKTKAKKQYAAACADMSKIAGELKLLNKNLTELMNGDKTDAYWNGLNAYKFYNSAIKNIKNDVEDYTRGYKKLKNLASYLNGLAKSDGSTVGTVIIDCPSASVVQKYIIQQRPSTVATDRVALMKAADSLISNLQKNYNNLSKYYNDTAVYFNALAKLPKKASNQASYRKIAKQFQNQGTYCEDRKNQMKTTYDIFKDMCRIEMNIANKIEL